MERVAAAKVDIVGRGRRHPKNHKEACMSSDRTMAQTGEELRQAQDRSMQRTRAPGQVPGYVMERFLGAGAYGEVWVAVDQNTARRVAIKFYNHRGGVDWSLLSREVEKLAFLFADRYVVQLIDVGWEADPPYYVMEFLEHGSLEDRLNQGPMTVSEAVEMFREVGVGLLHSHGKGVLHCDLKPANVLLDQDMKPRLADFGQSRLSHEQTPALGTLFYMAPEQADLNAAPDARWDVYALGALLYCMLTGQPPHRDAKAVTQIERGGGLEERLTRYRRLIETSPRPIAHRQVRGVDRDLADIIDRCLDRSPSRRFPNIQAVLQALDARSLRRARRPLLVLGAVGPALLLTVMGVSIWLAAARATDTAEQEARANTLKINLFAAQLAGEMASREIEANFRTVEAIAANPRLAALVERMAADPEVQRLAREIDLVDLATDDPTRVERRTKLQNEFRELPVYTELFNLLSKVQADLNDHQTDPSQWRVASIVLDDIRGVALARAPHSDTTGRYFGYRSYFHGGPDDLDVALRPAPAPLRKTSLSAVFQSSASGKWVVGISTPVHSARNSGELLGVLLITIEVRSFIEKFQGLEDQFAVLVDGRGKNRGLILQHPLFEKLAKGSVDFNKFRDEIYRVDLDDVPDLADLPDEGVSNGDGSSDGGADASLSGRAQHDYHDPLAAEPSGKEYDKSWLAAKQAVLITTRPTAEGEATATQPFDTGLFVIVQADREKALQPVHRLGTGLRRDGLRAMGVVVLFLTALWGFVIVVLNEPSRSRVFAALRRRAGLKSAGGASSSFSTRSGGTAGTGGSVGFSSEAGSGAAPRTDQSADQSSPTPADDSPAPATDYSSTKET
jgi:hypothetical protein